jgi:uncharacterized protein
MSTRAISEGFVGREAELAALERQARRGRAAFVPVYGRRRVGKTELLLRFCAGKRAIYFAATQGAAPQQLRSFMRAAAVALGKTLLAEVEPRDWEHALELVAEARGAGPLVLVLDEFQWLCESAPQLPSVLQKLWDHRWQREKGFTLVLCGSYVGFMEREVLGAKSPLFGRRTGQLQLGPLSFREAGAFFPRWSLEDRARAWFICGGIPAYLKAFDPARSVDQNIVSAFLEVDAPLMREAEFLLREELRDVGSYATLVEALAQGQTTPTALSKFAGIPVPRVMYFLKTLLELGYVDRREPLVPGRPSRKLARYAVVDPVLRFWFRFVAPNFSAIRRGPPRAAFSQLVAPHLETFYGAGFEAMCREALPRLLEREGIDGNLRVGEFWDPTVQIDAVALRADRWTLLGECKWGAVSSLPKLEAELRAKAKAYPLGTTTLDARLFVRRPLKGRQPSEPRVHTLSDLYR